jgi:integrase
MGVYTPYSKHRLPKLARDIMNNASLPTELRLSDLRRTGTTEMVDAGVSMGNIMAVTGHTNPQSVKPYMKNTLASANLALNLRKKLTDE